MQFSQQRIRGKSPFLSLDDETRYQCNFFTCQQVPLMLGACLTFPQLFIKLASLEKKRYTVIWRKKGKEGKKKIACRYMHAQHTKCTNFTRRFPAVYPNPYDLLLIFVSY